MSLLYSPEEPAAVEAVAVGAGTDPGRTSGTGRTGQPGAARTEAGTVRCTVGEHTVEAGTAGAAVVEAGIEAAAVGAGTEAAAVEAGTAGVAGKLTP